MQSKHGFKDGAISAETTASLPYHIKLVRALLNGTADQSYLPTVGNKAAWQALLHRGFKERLAGYYHQQFKRQKVVIPPQIAQQMKRRFLEQWQENGALLREISRISTQFQAADIAHLVYKGPIFANQIYANLGCRATSDIDLMLVNQTDVERATNLLAELNYERRSQVVAPLSITMRSVYEFEFSHADFDIDLHWTLQQHPSLNLDMQAIWNTRSEVKVMKQEVATFSAEYTLLAYALALPPDISNNSLKLRWFLELYLLLNQMRETTDWAAFWQRRARENTTHLVQVVMAAVDQLFGADGAAVIDKGWISAEAKQLAQHVIANFQQPKPELQRKRLAFSLYNSSKLISASWWLMTLPIRAATHPNVTRNWFRE